MDIEVRGNVYHFGSLTPPLDLLETAPGSFHILSGGKSYLVDILEIAPGSKQIKLKVNDVVFVVRVKSDLDDLLAQTGLNSLEAVKVAELRAPMPGLVLQVAAGKGDRIEKGQVLIILEAMKMENNIRASEMVVVKELLVRRGDKVEKNQVLMLFEPS